MRYTFFLISLLFLLSCTSSEDENLVYTYLNECNENYFENKGISASQELEAFYSMLVEENQLDSKKFESLSALLSELASNSIFPATQNIEIPSDHQFIQQPPQQLYTCVNDLYGIDSLAFTQTAYYKLENEILNYISTTSSPKINEIWKIYTSNLTQENYAIDFYRNNILMQLFRWYYVCKYEKESLTNLEE